MNVKDLKVFFMENVGDNSWFWLPVQQEIKESLKAAVNYLERECGCQVDDYKFNDLKYIAEMTASIYGIVKDVPELLKDTSNPEVRIPGERLS